MNNNILNRFAVNPVSLDIPRSKFNLDHSVTLSGNVGDLIPFTWFDVLPGSTFSVDTSKVIRMQPLVAPVMSNLYADFFWFFVPYRLIWNHFINFMGENTETAWTPQTEYSIPKIKIPNGGFDIGTIADYLGVPPKMGAGREINALPFRAYALICDTWFRSTALQNPVHVTVGDSTVNGVNTGDQVTDIEKGGKPFIANKYFDLFTAALPSPQRGPEATFSLAGLAPVMPIGNSAAGLTDHRAINIGDKVESLGFWRIDSNGKAAAIGDNDKVRTMYLNTDPSGLNPPNETYMTIGNVTQVQPANTTKVVPYNLWADLSNVTQFNINELRMAFAVQRYYEALARGGDRYNEIVKQFYGVTSDYRFMRPEFLGGSKIPVNVSQVTQTSESTEDQKLGDVAGQSVTGDVHSDFSKSFTEHGIIIGCFCLRYNHVYQQSLEKYWLKNDLFDFYNPKFANIGEQATMKDEIYFQSSDNDDVFGYNEAWYEYRFKPSRVAGEMRSMATTPLDMWHFGDYYDSAPSLSASWLREDKSNVDRCLAVTSAVANQFVADIYVSCKTAQPMPMYSIPGLIDHH